MANLIFEVALELQIEGDLASQMRLEHSDLAYEEAVWRYNFQTTNFKCPNKVKEWFVKNYKGRFNR